MSDLFNTKEISGSNEKTPIKAGERVKVYLESIIVNDDDSVNFNFKGAESSNSGVFSHKEFNIDPTDARYSDENKTRTMARVKHIANRYIPESVIDNIQAKTWGDWIRQVVAALGTSYKGVVAEAKITVNDKGYNRFPLFPNFLSTEKNPTQLKTVPKYDKYSVEPVETATNLDGAKEDETLPF